MKNKLIEVVRELKRLDTKSQAYINSIPSEFSIIFDNEYTDSKCKMNDLLIHALFKEKAEDIFWFIYEWEPGKKTPQIWLADDTEIILETEEDYYKYLKGYC